MYKTTQLLDMLKVEFDLPSDYALAKKLEITRGSVSKLRLGKSFPSTETAYNIAKLMYLNPLLVIASVEYERAVHYGNDEMKKLWKDAAKDLK